MIDDNALTFPNSDFFCAHQTAGAALPPATNWRKNGSGGVVKS
jgi:hypothetical protein